MLLWKRCLAAFSVAILSAEEVCFESSRRWPAGVRASAARVAGGPGAGRRIARIAIWLILPVVICLSQRLSHACLSISNLYGETANGSLNQLSFI